MVLFNHCIALISVWRPSHDACYDRSTICVTTVVHIVCRPSYTWEIVYKVTWYRLNLKDITTICCLFYWMIVPLH